MAVWANEGATVVRWQRGLTPTVTSIGLGTTLPLLSSATGRIFLTYAPKAAIRRARESELRRAARSPGTLPDMPATAEGVETLRRTIREQGYATVDGEFIPGLVAAAAPILDWQGEAQAVVTLVGVDPATVAQGSEPLAALRRFCQTHSVERTPAG